MKIKAYKLFKTSKKTAKENTLELSPSDNSRLFDFSLLDDMQISNEEKREIKETAYKYITAASLEEFYGKEYSNFEWCDGRAIYYPHKVYGGDGRRKYVIFQLAKILHHYYVRSSVWDSTECTTIETDCGYTMPLDDYEI